jgi:Protein of unknown function (DUF3168)
MTIDEGLWTKLAGDAAIRALVADRWYPDIIPEGKKDEEFKPAIAYGNSGETEESTQDGPCGLCVATMQVVCLASTPAVAHQLAGEVKRCLLDRVEIWGDVRVWNVEVQPGGRTADDSTGTVTKVIVPLNVTVAYRG